MSETPRVRSRIALRLSWTIAVGLLASGMVLGAVALAMTGQVLADDPCASGWPNPVAQSMSWVLLAALGASVASFGIALWRRVTGEVAASAVGLVAAPALSLLIFVFANAGYGWHCPEL